MEERVRTLHARLKEAQTKVSSLTILLKEMQEAKAFFDDEDFTYVQDVLQEEEQRIQEIQTELERYNSDFLKRLTQLQEIIEGRQQILDSVDAQTDVFGHYPGLLKFLAAKQKQLIKLKDNS